MCSSAMHSCILPSTSSLLVFIILPCALCRIYICLSGDTNWKIARGFPWAVTPTGSLLISGNLRKLDRWVVTYSILFFLFTSASCILSCWSLGGHGWEISKPTWAHRGGRDLQNDISSGLKVTLTWLKIYTGIKPCFAWWMVPILSKELAN